jgi:type VI secretion system protein ImpK
MRQNMALLLQEPLAAAARIRRGEGVSDAGFFRNRLIDNLRTAEEQARLHPYSGKDAKLAIFAVAAALDETILASREPVFAEWHRRPLCLEVFGTNLGGEIFFDNARLLLDRDNTPDTADVLEVYLLCLLLGFAGKHKNNDAPEIRQLTRTIREKIDRIRQAGYGLPASWELPPERTQVRSDSVARMLKIGAVAALCLVLAVFAASKAHLVSAVSAVANVGAAAGSSNE